MNFTYYTYILVLSDDKVTAHLCQRTLPAILLMSEDGDYFFAKFSNLPGDP